MTKIDIMDLWPSRDALAAAVGATRPAVDKWYQRGGWPASLDLKVLRAARRSGYDLSVEAFLKAAGGGLDDAPAGEDAA